MSPPSCTIKYSNHYGKSYICCFGRYLRYAASLSGSFFDLIQDRINHCFFARFSFLGFHIFFLDASPSFNFSLKGCYCNICFIYCLTACLMDTTESGFFMLYKFFGCNAILLLSR